MATASDNISGQKVIFGGLCGGVVNATASERAWFSA